MKLKLLILSLLIFSSLPLYSKTTYANSHKGYYVSKSHLKRIYNRVKRTSDVSQKALEKTFSYYEENRYKKKLSPNYIAIADYTKVATHKRLYIIDLHTGKVNRHIVAHGKNSGAKRGRVWRSSNVLGTNMTPFGFFKIGKKEGLTSQNKHKYLSVMGLEWKNRNAKKREILLHTASYVNWGGRSLGCFAIKPKDKWQVFPKVKNALFYSYTGK